MLDELAELHVLDLMLEQDYLSKKHKSKSKKSIPKEEEEEEGDIFANLPEDIIFKILVKVPTDYLYENFRLVCKAWEGMISTSYFIALKAAETKSQLLIQGPTSRKQDQKFKVKLLEMENEQLHFKLRDFGFRQMGRVRSSCNGFILINSPKRRGVLQAMNLVTKCFVTLPGCPSGCPHIACGSALTFDPFTDKYKVVHVYADGFGFEIFTIGCPENAWRRIPGPWKEAHDRPFRGGFHWNDPVLINERVLHWYVGSHDYIISMDASDEKFRTVNLPNNGKGIRRNRYSLLESGGHLSLLHNVSDMLIDVWVLEDLQRQSWFKKHSIELQMVNYTVNFDSLSSCKYFNALPNLDNLLPFGSLRNGEVLVFKHEKCDVLYVYGTKTREMRKFNITIKDALPFIPHRSTLSRWKNHQLSWSS